MKISLILLVVFQLVSLNDSSPIKNAESSFEGTDVIINCNNKELVKTMKAIGIPFKCMKTETPHTDSDESETLHPKSFNNKKVNSDNSKMFSKHVKCHPGYKFDPQTGGCFEVRPAENLIREPHAKPSSPAGWEGITMIEGVIDCEPGFIYNSEIDFCLELISSPSPADAFSKRPSSASLFGDDPNAFLMKWQGITLTEGIPECESGFIYNSEIDMCTDLSQTPSPSTIPELPSPSALVDDSHAPQDNWQGFTMTEGITECDPGFIYNSEIDMCLDLSLPTSP